jgi:hypothetical protein
MIFSFLAAQVAFADSFQRKILNLIWFEKRVSRGTAPGEVREGGGEGEPFIDTLGVLKVRGLIDGISFNSPGGRLKGEGECSSKKRMTSSSSERPSSRIAR